MSDSENSPFLQPEGYRDTISTVSDSGARRWIYALKPNGKYYNWRTILSYSYLLIFFALPLIKINGHPLFLINIIDSKFILFSKVFWPQDFYILAVGMVTFLIFIVVFTLIYGRVFCGWVCPQTIFMEFVFRKIEWWIDGSPKQQMALKNRTWDTHKIGKRVLKYTIFFALSFLIAHTFLSYIIGFDEVVQTITEPISNNIGLFIGLMTFTLLFFSVYAFVRELVCTTICPYGRLQGVMVDDDTMQVSYDFVRGEPRERFKKRQTREGDCVDCNKCVEVCPTGIDIRDGLQMECVGCTACIDACNEIMTKFNFEPNLIRFASKNNIVKGEKFKFNNRIKMYSILLGVLGILMGVLILTRKSIEPYLSRVSGQLYTEVGQNKDTISNYYKLRIINKTNDDIAFDLKIKNQKGTIKIIGDKSQILKNERMNEYLLLIYLPKKDLKTRNTKLALSITDKNNQELAEIKSNFYGPFK